MLDPLTAQRLIVAQVGDTDDGRLQTNIALLWDAAAGHALVYPELQFQYTKRGAIEMVLARERERSDTTTRKDNQRFTSLVQLHKITQDEIVRLERRASVNAAPASGVITATEPQTPPGMTDSLDSMFRGDPYKWGPANAFNEADAVIGSSPLIGGQD